MTARVYTAALEGIEASPVIVEVNVASGMRAFSIVGLPDNAVKESKERLVSALGQSGFTPPHQIPKRITVNLAPAATKKHGSGYDLPIALGFLIASEQLTNNRPRALVIGELALDGRVRPVRGVLAMAQLAKKLKIKELIVPWRNSAEASLVEAVAVFGVRNLAEVVAHLAGTKRLERGVGLVQVREGGQQVPEVDLRHVTGQAGAKRALEIAAAGGHNLIFHGPPGTGKTLLARALAGILPELSPKEALQVTQIYSAAGELVENVIRQRPFRNPHHQTSSPAILGGGSNPLPGELTLAHHGVLFLDELPEFRRDVLEGLRQPLEEGVVRVTRVSGRATFPARFLLIAAMNPCPCGYAGDNLVACRCAMREIQLYQRKVSGPILDRFDLHVAVPRLSADELLNKTSDSGIESSESVRGRVKAARARQGERFGGSLDLNSLIAGKDIKKYCVLEADTELLLRKAIARYKLSARAFHKLLKVTRTIADLDNKADIRSSHLTEALQYRMPLSQES